MLVMLLPDQVMHYWNIIKYGIEETLPPYVTHSQNMMENIQMALLIGKAQCWVYVDKEPKVKCVLITRTIYDDFTDSATFELTSIYSFHKITGEEWIEGFETIRKYAIGCKCKKIVFYSDDYTVLKIANVVGFKAAYTYAEYLL